MRLIMQLGRVIAAACALAMCQPALACNQDGFDLPWDLAKADRVVVARISNFRIVPNKAESDRIQQLVDAGTANSWEKKRYEENVSKGLPPGGVFGLFDVSVKEVLKGKAARRFTVIFPDARLCCYGHDEYKLLPTTFPDQDAMLGLSKSGFKPYYGSKLPVLHVNECVGPMLFHIQGDHPRIVEARRYFGSTRNN
jgi:hypothetical protein